MKEIGKGTVTTLIWIMFAVIIRPLFLLLEIVCVIFTFLFDVIVFPVEFAKRMEKDIERSEK